VVRELLDAIGARTPAPASGSAAALTGALAAALAEMAARYADDDASVGRATELKARLLALADEDAVVYSAFLAEPNAATQVEIIRVPEEVAAAAREVAEVAERVRAQLRTAVAGDAEAAVALAQAASGVAKRLAELNA
jgi:formiminotetrahydrofolate cyclodeaminase